MAATFVRSDLVTWSALGAKEITTNRGILLGAVITTSAPVQGRYARWMFEEDGPYSLIGEVGVWTVEG